MSNSIKELISAFNFNNYAFNEVNTNYTVRNKKIIGLFASDINVGEYLWGIGKKIIKRHCRTKEVASKYYNLNCFPFVLDANSSKKESSAYKGVMEIELADSTSNEVIRNLKVHFVNEFERAVGFKVVARLKEILGIEEEEAYDWIERTVQTGATDRSSLYLYCIAFDGEYLEEEGYSSKVFEIFKSIYVKEFNSRLEKCGLKDSDFYEYKDGVLYIKDVSDRVVKSAAEYVKKEIALDFETPGSVESKVENYKNVLSELIYKWTGRSIYGYDYDIFKDTRKIESGNSFALIPLVVIGGQLELLNSQNAKKVNTAFSKIDKRLRNTLSDIKGKTENQKIVNHKEPVYGISNKRIAQLLPIIMQSPIAYNKELGRFEFAVNLENFRSQQRLLSPNSGSDREDSPSSSLDEIGFPRQGTLSSPLLLRRVEAKKNVLCNFIRYLPLEKNEKSRAEIHSFLSSDEGAEELYSILSAFRDRDGLYSELHLSCEQRNEMEEKWRSLHQFKESLSASSEGLAGLTLGGPRCRNSVASKDSKDSAYYTEPPTSRRSSVGSVGSSYEDDFPRNSLQASLISKSSTESSISSNASVGTVIGVEEDSSSESSSSRSASSEPHGNIYDENMPGPSAKLLQMELESPQRDQSKELKRSPRLESEEGGLQSSGYQLPTQLSVTKVSGSQSQQSVSAAYNVQAGTNTQPQEMNPSLQQGTHENKWSQSLQPGPSGLSQQRPSLWPQGGHSSTTSAWSQPMDPWSLPALSGDIPGFLLPTQVDFRDKPLTEKEEELIKALLYAFNLNNYILECPNTNFIVENGKIASSINDDVNVEEYLQELRDYTIKEYCGTEEEAKEEGYDLNEFPFKFLSNCGNQEIKVVANISRGALLNLKKLFIRHEQGVKIEGIDINTVEKAVEFQKNSWVDSQVKGGYCNPQAAIESCYPDESVLKDIPIIKGEDGYYLDRIYGTLEVESFMEKRLHAKDTSKAEKMKPEDNKESGYSSGSVTDAEKGEKSPKCRSQSPVGNPSLKWATPNTAAFVLDSVSHVKNNIDKSGEDSSGAIKVTEEGKFGSSKLEPRHQWLDRERHRRSTKQATKEESISNWVWE
ncbi:MAG: hypothetical protein LKM45_03825 [Wolbachia endosymbiont of Alcedoecus sp.]|nr:hypothetical protein [Wolbachia endosymbiont of Alcedoecus sp.]